LGALVLLGASAAHRGRKNYGRSTEGWRHTKFSTFLRLYYSGSIPGRDRDISLRHNVRIIQSSLKNGRVIRKERNHLGDIRIDVRTILKGIK
jgi:hypothetical protein